MGDDIAEAIQALKISVDVLKANPELLHTPELSFFKDYLQSFGAKLPSPNEQTPVRGTDYNPMRGCALC
jgi:hypothetical protein